MRDFSTEKSREEGKKMRPGKGTSKEKAINTT